MVPLAEAQLANHNGCHVSVTKDHRGQHAHEGHISSPLRLSRLTVTHLHLTLVWTVGVSSQRVDKEARSYSFASCFIKTARCGRRRSDGMFCIPGYFGLFHLTPEDSLASKPATTERSKNHN